MFEGILDKTLNSINALKLHLGTSQRFREFFFQARPHQVSDSSTTLPGELLTVTPPDSVQWKIIDHSCAITRLYAVFEQFVQELLREYLTFIEGNFVFSEIEESFRKEYRRGFGFVLGELDKERFSHLALADLAKDLFNALDGKNPYRLLPEALTGHDQNLRLPELNRVFGRCGISDLQGWIARHKLIEQFFQGQNRIAATAEKQLKQIVDYRNDAAHNGLDIGDVLGSDILNEFCDFLASLCVAVAERVRAEVIQRGVAKGLFAEQGRITEKIRSKIVIATAKGKFRAGQTIFLKGETYCEATRLNSIQLNGIPHEEIEIAQPTELGFGLSTKGRLNARVFVDRAFVAGEQQ